jgi:Domain of unknown function (DUF5666)
MLLQYPYPYPGRTQRPQPNANAGGANTDAVATFTGTFKSADKKYIFLDLEDGNTMRMFITGATKFMRDDKAAKASDFRSGDKVTVDASRDARMNLLAVRVEAVPAKAPEGKQEPPPPDKQATAPQ